eukprot:TRINITY_DN360_c0_g1_i1.p1 TRINITY_DN360_c0_g1~~TRINITY_DN360_c0_g1_i1.p1  ORF type:complete len:445 (+),score=117.25 TRINITY_DN360_c0_g1_i1:134-1468(+)
MRAVREEVVSVLGVWDEKENIDAGTDKALRDACWERKQASLKKLHEWDYSVHRALGEKIEVLEVIQGRVDMKWAVSCASFDEAIRFFREKSQHDKAHGVALLSALPKLSLTFRERETYREVYPSLGESLREHDDVHRRQGRAFHTMATYIETDILPKLLEVSEKSNRSVGGILKRLIANKEAFTKQMQANRSLMKTVEGTAQRREKRGADILATTMELIASNRQLTRLMNDLASESLEFWANAISFDKLRVETLQACLIGYYAKSAEVFGNGEMTTQKKLVEPTKVAEEVEVNYAPTAILPKVFVEENRGVVEAGADALDVLKGILAEVKVPEFRDVELVAKRFEVERLREGGVTDQRTVVISIDDHLLVLPTGEDTPRRPEETFDLTKCTVSLSSDSLRATIRESTSTLLVVERVRTLNLRFLVPEEVEVFQFYCSRARSNIN